MKLQWGKSQARTVEQAVLDDLTAEDGDQAAKRILARLIARLHDTTVLDDEDVLEILETGWRKVDDD